MVRFRDGQKLLFNPVQKSALADRPEERVRLRMIEFLVREAGFSLNRMSTEIGIKSFTADSALRTDILCFDELHRPLLLVECKSESVKLDEKAAIQIARYNRTVKSPYILLTNGIRDMLFAVREDESIDLIQDLEKVFPLTTDANRDLSYWVDRSLWGKSSFGGNVQESTKNPAMDGNSGRSQISTENTTINGSDELAIDSEAESADVSDDAIIAFLNSFWESSYSETQYLKLQLPEELAENVGVGHLVATFFKVYPRSDDGRRIAIALYGDTNGETRILVVASNPDSTPTWMIFEVAGSSETLILQKGWIKNKDEKSVKIPDNLGLDITNLDQRNADEKMYSILSKFV
jgi:hypothetical protein